MKLQIEESYKVAQISDSQLSTELMVILRSNATFVDGDDTLDEFIISAGTLDDIVSLSGEITSDGLIYKNREELKTLYELLGDEYSYLHITRV